MRIVLGIDKDLNPHLDSRVKYLHPSADLDDVLADLQLISTEGVIADDDIYVDTWLEALRIGAELMKTRPECEIDTIDEPEPLSFRRQIKGIEISFKGTSVVADSVEEILDALTNIEVRTKRS